jgi:hypothetical protein
MDMATIDELESRMRFVEADIASEKEVSLATLQQAVRNGAALSNLRTELGATTHRIDQMVADAAVANSTLRHHSTLLTVLQQDVTAFRHDVTAQRRGQEELHGSTGSTPGSTGRTPGSTGWTAGSTGSTPGSTGSTPGSTGRTPGSTG